MSTGALIGHDLATGQPVLLGDEERLAGLYVSGSYSNMLLYQLIEHDIQAGHGLFFLNDRAFGVASKIGCLDLGGRRDKIQLYDPTLADDSFSINLFACRSIQSETERRHTFNRARRVFDKLFEKDHQDAPWLKLIIPSTINVFIENPDYTITDIPQFLSDRDFREHLVANVRHNPEAVDFWRHGFHPRQAESMETRVRTLLSNPDVYHLVAPRRTTLDFASAI